MPTRQKSVAILVVDRVRIKSVVVKLEDAPAGYPCVLKAVSSMARGIVPVRLPNEGTIVHSNAALVALAREFGEGNLVMLSRVGPKQQNTTRSIDLGSASAASTVRSAMRAARSGGKP